MHPNPVADPGSGRVAGAGLPAYLAYWGLRETPFSLAPNPAMFYLSDQHRECLMRLKFAIHSGKGGALLISENAGNGKTTTLKLLMDELSRGDGERFRLAYLDYPTMSPEQMVGEIARQLGVEGVCGDKVSDLNALRDLLRSNHIRGVHSLVVVDEGQMLADRPDLLNELRILLNFTTSGAFLLSFILSGQAPLEPAVRAMPEFWQRLPVRFFLKDLHFADTCGMIHHRLKVAGADRPIFTETALEGVFRFSKGCPRVVCAVADLALLVGHGNRARQVDFVEVTQACTDMEHSGGSYHYFHFLETEGTAPAPVAPAPVAPAPVAPAPVAPAPVAPAPVAPVPVAPAPVAPVPVAPVPVAPVPVAPAPIASAPETPVSVSCPACGETGPPDQEACAQCGVRMQTGCERCRAPQPITHRTCSQCGFPLHAWAREAERTFLAGLKRLNLYRSPREAEALKFQHHRTLDGRILYFTRGAGMLRKGARVRISRPGHNGRLRGSDVIVGNRRLVFLNGRDVADIPLYRLGDCEGIPGDPGGDAGDSGGDSGGILVHYRDAAYELHLPVREGRRVAFYRLLRAYLERMREGDR